MGRKSTIIILLFFCSTFSFELLLAQQEIKSCQKEPPFIRTLGFDPLWTALSTAEKKMMGIVLVEFEKKPSQKSPTSTSARKTYYQHPSWVNGGFLSTISFDFQGNAYAIPAPMISMLHNSANKLNTIYQIDANTGIMREWINIPFYSKPTIRNPYGLLGITYDCTADILIASSVAGSDRYAQKGILYLIQVGAQKIVDTLKGIDAMGLAVAFDEKNQKRLYFGEARSGLINSIAITSGGKFLRKTIRVELSLEGFGPRGDDKARKIKFVGNQMQVSGIAFNYNLQAQSEKPETIYTFSWDTQTRKWILIQLQ